MEPEPEDEEQAAAAAAAEEEAPGESTVAAARVDVAGHEVATDSTALDVSEWGLTAAQVREVAGALPQLPRLRELVLDGVPVSGSTPRDADFQNGAETVDADLGSFRVLCEGLRGFALGLTSLSLRGCYLGPKALAVLARLVSRQAASPSLASLKLTGATFGFIYKGSNLFTGNCWGDPETTFALDKCTTGDVRGNGYNKHGPFTVSGSWSADGNVRLNVTSSNGDFPMILQWRHETHSLVGTAKDNDGETNFVLTQRACIFQLFCDALKHSSVIEIDLSACGLGPSAMDVLCDYFHNTDAAINSLAIGLNPIGDEAMVQLLHGLRDVSLASLDISKTDSGVSTTTTLAELLAEETKFQVAIKSLTVDSTGSPKLTSGPRTANQASGPRTYTLSMGDTTIDLSKKNLGPADVTLLTTWMQRPEVSATLMSLKLSGEQGVAFGMITYGLAAAQIVISGSQNSNINCTMVKQGEVNGQPRYTAVDSSAGMYWTTKSSRWLVLDPYTSDSVQRELCQHSIECMPGLVPYGTHKCLSYKDEKWQSDTLTVMDASIQALWIAVKASQVTEVDLSYCGLGSTAGPIMSDYIRDYAALASVNFSGNGLTGAVKNDGQWENIDSDLSGFVSLCAVLGKVTEVNLSDCGLGSASMLELAKAFSGGDAAVKKVALSNNFLFGSKSRGFFDSGRIHDIDNDQSGWSTFCDALPGSQLEELLVADVGMGAVGSTSLAKAISASSSLFRVNVLSNSISAEGAHALIETFEQNTNLHTLLGVEQGVVDLSKVHVNDLDCFAKVLAAELRATYNRSKNTRDTLASETKLNCQHAAVSGFEQGVGYLATNVVDLSASEFGIPSSRQLNNIICHTPELEALFLAKGTILDQSTIRSIRAQCPKAHCIALGGEISHDDYNELHEQFQRHDAELATALGLSCTRLPEGIPGTQQLPPKSGHVATCRVLDLSHGKFSGLTDAGMSELPLIFPNISALFLATDTKVTREALSSLAFSDPPAVGLIIGAEFTRVGLLRLLGQYQSTKRLDLCQTEFLHVTDAGLRELVALCPCAEAVFTFANGKILRADLDALQTACPSTHFVTMDVRSISFAAQTAALDAKAELERQQDALRKSAAQNQSAIAARNEARQMFLALSTELSRAMTKDGPLVVGPADPVYLEVWRRAQRQERQLALFAAECQQLAAQSEPKRSTTTLQELQDKDDRLHRAVKMAQLDCDKLRLIESEATSSSPRHEPVGADVQRVHFTAEQLQARAALLAQPMQEWTEEQVQQWIGLIGLPTEQAELVQRVLAEEQIEGDELQDIIMNNLKLKWLIKKLQKSGVTDATGLAEQTMALLTAAQVAVRGEDKLMAARNAVDTARAELRRNAAALRSEVVHLVWLASQHFPELLGHKDVQKFKGSDGLFASDHRQLADYEDVRPLHSGRNELLIAKYDGVDVCLKRFLIQGDMRAYTREVLRVQRLWHPFIIHFTAAFQDKGSMYLEMEYFPHGSLRNWINTTQPDAAQSRALLRKVLQALACTHGQNIVHCDIKPENVLVANDGTPRICDFEMSKDLNAALSSTMAGFTRGFVAPEILNGQAKPSCASDMFAFGMLVLNAVCELGPGDTYPMTDVSKVADDFGLQDLVRRLLSKDPASRPKAVQLQAEPYFADDCVAELAEVARLRNDMDARMGDVIEREAVAALAAGATWLCEDHHYDAATSRALELAFQRLRLFPEDGNTMCVDIHHARVAYCVTVRNDSEEIMMQRRLDTGKERVVRRQMVAVVAVQLPECATIAIERATGQAQCDSESALPRLLTVMQEYGGRRRSMEDVQRTMEFFARAAALHMNVDPFKNVDGKPMLHLYCNDDEGRYRTLFETGTGGGSLDLHQRRGWERRLFGDAYDGHDADRPKYGNVNFLAHMKGDRAATQYGSSYLMLRPEVRARCTITSMDSSYPDARLGTLEHCAHVLLHIIEMCPIGKRQDLVELLLQLGNPAQDEALAAIEARAEQLRDVIPFYTELQIHGPVQFDRDVTLIVVAEPADILVRSGVPRVVLTPEEQALLWRRFAERFGVQAFRMGPNGMVPLS